MSAKGPRRETKAAARNRTAKARAARRDRANAAARAVSMSQVVQLRVRERKGFRDIASALGLSVGHVHELLEEALTAEQGQWSELAARERVEQLAQLEQLECRLLPLVMTDDLRVIKTSEDGSVMELEEFERVTKVTDRLLKVYERRSRLLGLDAPAKVKVESTNFETLAELRARLAESKRREGGK